MDVIGILEIVIHTMWTYPAVPFIGTAMLASVFIVGFLVWCVFLVFALIMSKFQPKVPTEPIKAAPYDPAEAERNREWLRQYKRRKEMEERWKTRT